MSFRQELMKHLDALPVVEVKKLVSKYNKELDIKPVSRLKKAEILQKIKDKKPMDQQLITKLTNEARAKREGKKAQKASEKEAAKKPVEKFGTEKKKIKVKKAKPDFLDLDKDGDKKEPMKKAAKEAKKSAPKAMPKEEAKAFAAAFAKAPEEEKGSLFANKLKKEIKPPKNKRLIDAAEKRIVQEEENIKENTKKLNEVKELNSKEPKDSERKAMMIDAIKILEQRIKDSRFEIDFERKQIDRFKNADKEHADFYKKLDADKSKQDKSKQEAIEEIGNKVLPNGFKVKDLPKYQLYLYHRDEYLKYYGKDMTFKIFQKNPELARGPRLGRIRRK